MSLLCGEHTYGRDVRIPPRAASQISFPPVSDHISFSGVCCTQPVKHFIRMFTVLKLKPAAPHKLQVSSGANIQTQEVAEEAH